MNPQEHWKIDFERVAGVAEGVAFDPHAFTGGLEYVARQRPLLSSVS